MNLAKTDFRLPFLVDVSGAGDGWPPAKQKKSPKLCALVKQRKETT